jgi:predicted nucleotidyltransferase
MASDLIKVLSHLHDQRVEFIIVGGVAAVLHGGRRVTFDLDLIPRVDPDSWRATVDALWTFGARPRIPEPIERIRDVEQIQRWQVDKGMSALTMSSPDGRLEVDLLVSESHRFEELRERSVKVTVDHRSFLVASLEDLIDMKLRAGRPQDLLDIEELRAIQQRIAGG